MSERLHEDKVSSSVNFKHFNILYIYLLDCATLAGKAGVYGAFTAHLGFCVSFLRQADKMKLLFIWGLA